MVPLCFSTYELYTTYLYFLRLEGNYDQRNVLLDWLVV